MKIIDKPSTSSLLHKKLSSIKASKCILYFYHQAIKQKGEANKLRDRLRFKLYYHFVIMEKTSDRNFISSFYEINVYIWITCSLITITFA